MEDLHQEIVFGICHTNTVNFTSNEHSQKVHFKIQLKFVTEYMNINMYVIIYNYIHSIPTISEDYWHRQHEYKTNVEFFLVLIYFYNCCFERFIHS